MKEHNTIVQDAARAFGERIIAEFAYKYIQTAEQSFASVVNLYLSLHLHGAILKDASWFMVEGIFS